MTPQVVMEWAFAGAVVCFCVALGGFLIGLLVQAIREEIK